MKLKHYFGAGLLVILPAFITIYVLFLIFRFIDGIWGRVINSYLRQNFGLVIPGIGIIIGLCTVVIIGFIATNFVGKRFIHILENWFLRFPLVKQVYPAIKQIVVSLISQEHSAFKKVVMVEYPSKGIWSVGFLTNDSFKEAQEKTGEELLHVFIGTTPTPLSGFLILVPKKSVKILDMPVEEGIKLIVSGGIVKPDSL
ncbi:MAG: DUF502 domain-containing protein [Candidatus Omnitrophica bacterium]|nr:DUF502 domain-containing protein [Candidatus Omnitrophota bacterium]